MHSSTGSDTWSFLPDELLRITFKKLDHPWDLLRFRDVCKSWQYFAAVDGFVPEPLCPLLLLYEHHSTGDNGLQIYDISDEKIFQTNLYNSVINITQGWLVFHNKDDTIILINPLMSSPVIQLPPHHSVWKVVASSDPLDPNCIFMSISLEFWEGSLAFCRIRDTKWQLLNHGDCCPLKVEFQDIVYNKNCFFALQQPGNVYVVLLAETTPKITQVVACSPETYWLVESSGDLLRVEHHDELKIKLAKLNFDSWMWEEVSSLGDNALLLSSLHPHRGECLSVSAIFKGDCIYFEKSAFNLKTRRFGDIMNNYSGLWFMPNIASPYFSSFQEIKN